MSPIYTRTGDGGETGLGDNRRVPKWNPRIEALGALDELNSQLGLALAMLPPRSAIRPILPTIQHLLLAVGSHVALPASPAGRPVDAEPAQRARVPAFPPGATEALEATIDRWWARLPPLSTFILPGGTPAAAALHIARTGVRRAERYVCALHEEIDPAILKWLNRLSDFLFAAARIANFEQRVADVTWEKELKNTENT